MTLEEFQATGRDCPDLGAALADECLQGAVGRLYSGGSLWIEDTTNWPTDAPGYGHGRWYTLIGNCQYQSDTLIEIEWRLYEFALDSGYTTEDVQP